jgi:hypothetical protein
MYPPVRQLTTSRHGPSPTVGQREREANAEALERLSTPDPDPRANERTCR